MLQIVIDTCCATFAEVQKRGEEFWSEFELYAADMLVGVVVNVALVGMLAPYVRFSGGSGSEGLLGRVKYAYDALPNLLCFAYGWWYTSNNFFYLCRIIHGASIIGSWVKFFFNHGCLQFECDHF